jgi:DNA-binding response OmpR family regulator
MLMKLDKIVRRSLKSEEWKQLVPVRGGPTILLVEDDADMREMLAGALRKDGYTVIEAADGDDALEWLGLGALEGEPRRWPSLRVSDICLPCLSGLDILEGLALAMKRLPVVMITGFGDAATHARALQLGATCVLDKPFLLEDFRLAVRAALRARGGSGPGSCGDGHVV